MYTIHYRDYHNDDYFIVSANGIRKIDIQEIIKNEVENEKRRIQNKFNIE